jgi:hypothetical protein
MAPAPEVAEVRRCPECREAAAVCIRTWGHTVNSISVGAGKREFCCQACGAYFLVRPKSSAIGMFVVAALLVPMGLMGLIGGTVAAIAEGSASGLAVIPIGLLLSAPGTVFLVLGLRFLGLRTPVVPGTPVPLIRYRNFPKDEGPRRCRFCGGVATCTGVTVHRTNGIPSGTDWAFQCSACMKTFEIESVWGMTVSALVSVVAFLGGLALLSYGVPDASRPTWNWWAAGFGVVFTLVGPLLWWQIVERVRNRVSCAQVSAQ